MADKAQLESLLERVRAATGPDRELDYAVSRFADGELARHSSLHLPYTASIDASLALVERLLPGWRWGISSHSLKDGVYQEGPHAGLPRHVDGFRAHVTERSALRPMPSIADARTAPLALLAALLSALNKDVR